MMPSVYVGHVWEYAKLILVVTYGNNTGASASISSKYFKKNTGRSFDAMYSVKMPDNYFIKNPCHLSTKTQFHAIMPVSILKRRHLAWEIDPRNVKL